MVEMSGVIGLIAIGVTIILAVAGALWRTIYDKIISHGKAITEIKEGVGGLGKKLSDFNTKVGFEFQGIEGRLEKAEDKLDEHAKTLDRHEKSIEDHSRVIKDLTKPRKRPKRSSSPQSS